MKHYFMTICIIVLLTGCGAGSNLNIVSPSASDEEVRKRADEVLKEKGPSAPKEKPLTPPASPAGSTESVSTREMKPSDEVLKGKSPSAPMEKPSTPPAPPAGSTENVPAREIKPSDESSMKDGSAQDALINLLEKKGIITRKELMEEMKRLDQGSK